MVTQLRGNLGIHDDVIKWKHFPRNWPFVRGIHRSPVNSPHKGQWRGYLMFSLICVWINGWANNREAGDLRRYRAHYGVTVMYITRDHWNATWASLRFKSSANRLFLFISLLRPKTKITPKFRITGPLWGESTGDRQRTMHLMRDGELVIVPR